MFKNELLPDFWITVGNGLRRPFDEFLADFNILAIRRVPEPSHGPATELLRSLLAENRGVEDATVRGFDIRSPDQPCETCRGPHIVSQGLDLVTICDSDCSIYRRFDVGGLDRFFIIKSDRRVIDVGSIGENRWPGVAHGASAYPSPQCVARAPPEYRRAGRRDAAM